MDREQQDEFSQVRNLAMRRIRGKHADSSLTTRFCKYQILPSFGNATSWEVLSTLNREGKSLRLYKSCWRYDVDSEAFRTPVERLKHPKPYHPTIEKGWVELPASEFYGILSLLSGVAIPIYLADQHAGLDGVRYELTLGGDYCFNTIHWWSSLPREWKPLATTIGKLRKLFEKVWDSNVPQIGKR